MPETRSRRTLLPLLTSHQSGRSALTCRMRCGDACSQEVPNDSDNTYFGDVLAESLSRRGLLKAGAIVAATGALSTVLGQDAAYAGPKPKPTGKDAPGLRFDPVPVNTLDAVSIPNGYEQQVVIGWGDRLFSDAPAFDVHNQTAAAQQRQFGYNNDYVGLLPTGKGTQLLVVNHEYTDEHLMFPGYDAANPTVEQVEIAWAAHGLSIVAVKESKASGQLTPVVDHPLNRRLHTSPEFELAGPAAGADLLKTSADPSGTTVLGTLNNCSGGLTPWGTWLTAQENFNQYFANAASVADPTDKARLARYGMSGGASERQWEKFDDRFDLTKEPNEANRFGWIVEVDPYDPQSTPKLHTALGRFKHEAAQPRITTDGRVAVYMGDDERFDYFYKFVSTDKYKSSGSNAARAHNMTLLDNGTLYVARFTGNSPTSEIDGSGKLPSDGKFDGTGAWIALASGTTSYVEGMTAEEVYIFTRLAADKVGATKMDRPEDIEPNPATGVVYVVLTNNSDRGKAGKPGADEVNPRNQNRSGQIVEVTETGNDAAATTFNWGIFLVCGDPADTSTYFAGFDKSQVSPISCPDNVAFDKYGNLWIATDGNALGYHDGLFGVATSGKYRGQIRQFLSVPNGAETCGPVITDERILVAVQHPGETDDATFESPTSHWPDGGSSVPRPSVVAVWRQGKNAKIGH